MYKTSLQQLVVLESKKVPGGWEGGKEGEEGEKGRKRKPKQNIGVPHRDTGANRKSSQWPKPILATK